MRELPESSEGGANWRLTADLRTSLERGCLEEVEVSWTIEVPSVEVEKGGHCRSDDASSAERRPGCRLQRRGSSMLMLLTEAIAVERVGKREGEVVRVAEEVSMIAPILRRKDIPSRESLASSGMTRKSVGMIGEEVESCRGRVTTPETDMGSPLLTKTSAAAEVRRSGMMAGSLDFRSR